MKNLIRGTCVIAEKDLRGLFLSPLFYSIAGLCAIAWTLVYFLGLRNFAEAAQGAMFQQGVENGPNLHFVVFAQHVSLVNLLMIFAVSAMSMRLFTEEKRGHTMSLLLTAPVTATEITLGKLFAGLIATWGLIGISFLYPLSLAFFAKLDWGPLISSYIGLLMLSGCYVAIGMLASSLTESPVLSVIMSVIMNVMLWFVGALSDAVQDPDWLRKSFEHLNVGVHFMNFIKGSISLASFSFFLSVIVLMTFLTQRVIESNRWR